MRFILLSEIVHVSSIHIGKGALLVKTRMLLMGVSFFTTMAAAFFLHI